MNRQKVLVSAAVLAAVAGAAVAAELEGVVEKVGNIEVCHSPKVELVAIVCRLAGVPGYVWNDPGKSRFADYDADIAKWFAPYAKEPAVLRFRCLCQKYGNAYDSPMSLAMHLKDDISGFLVPMKPIPPRCSRGLEPVCNEMETIRRELVDFRRKSRFDKFYTAHRPKYKKALEPVVRDLKWMKLDKWLRDYYGPQTTSNRYRVVVCSIIFSHNYGCSVELADGSTLYTPVTSCGSGTLPHEFSHGFTNSISDRILLRELPRDGEVYAFLWHHFEKVRKQMENQAYGCLLAYWRETFVRANEMRFVIGLGGVEQTERAQQYEERNGFALVRMLSGALEIYERNRKDYPTLADFAPEIVKTLSVAAKAKGFGRSQK